MTQFVIGFVLGGGLGGFTLGVKMLRYGRQDGANQALQRMASW